MLIHIFTAICFFVRICTSLCCVIHLGRQITYDSRLSTHHSTDGHLFRVTTVILSPQHASSIFVIYNSHLHNDLSFFFSLDRPILGSLLDNSSSTWPDRPLWQCDCSPAPLYGLASVGPLEPIAEVSYGGAPIFSLCYHL